MSKLNILPPWSVYNFLGEDKLHVFDFRSEEQFKTNHFPSSTNITLSRSVHSKFQWKWKPSYKSGDTASELSANPAFSRSLADKDAFTLVFPPSDQCLLLYFFSILSIIAFVSFPSFS